MPLKDDDPPDPPVAISKAEYETLWLPPAVAHRPITHMDVNFARAAIYDRIRTGRIRTVAEQMTMQFNNMETAPAHYWIIDRRFWKKDRPDHLFWASSDTRLVDPTAYGRGAPTYVCSGVRLERSGIMELAAQGLLPASMVNPFNATPPLTVADAARAMGAPSKKPPPPSTKDIDQWFDALTDDDKLLSVRNLHKLAQQTYPGAQRTQFEHYGKDRSRGRRRKAR